MVLATLAALGVIAFFFLIRTQPGQRLVLEEVVELIEGSLNGTLTVDDIRSSDLRGGGTLYGIRLVGPDGEPFVAADSARLSYAWRTFLGGDIVLEDVVLFSPVVFITRDREGEPFNAQVIFAGDEEDPETAAEGRGSDFIIRNAVMVDGTVRVLFPADPDAERAVVVDRGGDGPDMQRYAFDDVDGTFPLVRIAGDADSGVLVEVSSLSARAQIYQDPFELNDLRGSVRWARDLVTVDADRVVLGGSEASGVAVVDVGREDGLALELEATPSDFDLSDLQWLEPRLPDGRADGELALELSPGTMIWDFEGLHVVSGASDVRARGIARLIEGRSSFDGLELDMTSLQIDELRPWVEGGIPIDGTVSGNVTMDGEPADLRARGRLTLRQPGTGRSPTTAGFDGLFHVADGFGVTDLTATLDPVDYGLLAELVPDMIFGGTGRLEIEATGSLSGGLRFDVDMVHRAPGVPTSRILANGTVRRSGEQYVLDVTSDVGPLSFTALSRYFPDLPVTGEVRGMIQARGPLSDLRVTTDLDTEAGQLDLESRFDVQDPGAFYEVQGDVTRFRLSSLIPALPDPTILTGNIFLQGSGLDAATADVTARIRARDSRVGGLFVDTTALNVSAGGGMLRVDTLEGVFGGVSLRGGGTLALTEGGPEGEVRISFETDSIGKLRPLLLGEDVIAQDTLRPLARQVLVLEGVNPDTLPLTEDVTMSGSASGEVALRGSLSSFSAEGDVAFEEAEYGAHFIRNGRLTFFAEELPSLDGEVRAELQADSLRVFGRAFSAVELDLDYTRPGGYFDLFLVRNEAEDYRARARFEVDTAGGSVEVEELVLRFDTMSWELQDRAVVSWEGAGVTIQNLELVRPGPDPMRIVADGRLPTEGPADFDLRVENARLDRLTQLLQMEETGLEGVATADLSVRGTAAAPEVSGEISVVDFRFRTFDLTRIEGEVDYASRTLNLDLEAWDGELRVLQALGTVPVDLSLTGAQDRLLDEEMDVQVVADSLPAEYVLGFVEALEDVEGTVEGEFRIRGTVENPEPGGVLALQGAAWTLPALGVRYEDVQGTLDVQPDGTVEVDATARADGTARVTGSILLEPLTNPTFDLRIALDGFRAVDRRDVEGNVSGEVTLTRTFDQPLVQGLASGGRGLTVDRGVLYLDEFVRSASVVDLGDPRFLDVADTTFIRARPIIRESQNPFLQNLRVNVDLAVEDNTWLRSEEMNVEIGGDLVVTYDRLQGDLVLVGDLEAIRGEYTILGRRFEVQSGQVEFVGIAGINPNLSIQARTQVRRPQGDPLTIVATVTGTLSDLRVELSSPTETVAQSDLVSYLIFGQPSYALGSGQRQFVEGAAGDFLSAGISAFGGTLTSQLGTLLARQAGLDYLAISQPSDLLGGSLGASFAQTTVEAGFYLEDNLFAVLVLRPLSSLGSASSGIFGGARLEWAATENYTVELFIEDRFLRSRAFGFQELGSITTDLVKGFFVFREWGY